MEGRWCHDRLQVPILHMCWYCICTTCPALAFNRASQIDLCESIDDETVHRHRHLPEANLESKSGLHIRRLETYCGLRETQVSKVENCKA
jgi:hypothetical protein